MIFESGRPDGSAASGEANVEGVGLGVFEGVVTSAGGGGFSSVRSGVLALEDCSAFAGLQVRCKGDGRIYKLQVTCDEWSPGVKYQVEFETVAGQWGDFDFAWGDFLPSIRGQFLPSAPPLAGYGITSLGFLTSKLTSAGGSNSKFASGAFRLTLASISTF